MASIAFLHGILAGAAPRTIIGVTAQSFRRARRTRTPASQGRVTTKGQAPVVKAAKKLSLVKMTDQTFAQ
jgi:hypothetical protein